jgi:hypothetical protein
MVGLTVFYCGGLLWIKLFELTGPPMLRSALEILVSAANPLPAHHCFFAWLQGLSARSPIRSLALRTADSDQTQSW